MSFRQAAFIFIALALPGLSASTANGQQSPVPTPLQTSNIPNVYQIYFRGLTNNGNPVAAIVKEGDTGRITLIPENKSESDTLIEFSVVSDVDKSEATGRDLVAISTSISRKQGDDWLVVASPSIYTDLQSSKPATLKISDALSFSIDAKSIQPKDIPAACAALTGRNASEFDLKRIVEKLTAVPGPTNPIASSAQHSSAQGVPPLLLLYRHMREWLRHVLLFRNLLPRNHELRRKLLPIVWRHVAVQ